MASAEQSFSISELSAILGRIRAEGAFDTDLTRLKQRAADVRGRLAQLGDEAASLQQELVVLDCLLQESGEKPDVKSAQTGGHLHPLVSGAPRAPAEMASRGKSHPLTTRSVVDRPKAAQLSPKQQAERAAKVLAAARSIAKNHGTQITAASVAQHLIETKFDLGVPADRVVTAVGNIIFRAKDEFEWVRKGVYRFTGGRLNGNHAGKVRPA